MIINYVVKISKRKTQRKPKYGRQRKWSETDWFNTIMGKVAQTSNQKECASLLLGTPTQGVTVYVPTYSVIEEDNIIKLKPYDMIC